MNPRYTLISHVLCPYVQRAAITLHEKGIDFLRVDVDLGKKPDWFLAMSPLGKTPLLQVDDHAPIFESAVICEYLDDTIEPRLHPQDALTRARHRGWIEFASTTLNSIWGLYTAKDETTFLAKRDELASRFRQLEAELGKGPYFAGEAFSLVDAAFGPVFRYFDVFDTVFELGIFDGLPKVSAWRHALAQRPSVRQVVVADYPARLKAFVQRQGGYLGRLIDEQAVAEV